MSRRDVSVAVLFAAVLTSIIVIFGGSRLSGLDVDVLYRLQQLFGSLGSSATPSPVAVIAIDEETYQNPPFAGTPKVLWTPEIATVLSGVLDAGATAIGFDMVLPTSVDSQIRGFDRLFMRVLRRAGAEGRVVLGMVQHSDAPISPFAGHLFAAGGQDNLRPLNVITDADGINRRVPLFFKPDADGAEPLVTSMSLELAARHLGERPEIDTATGVVTLGGYSVPARSDPHLPAGPAVGTPLRNDMLVRFDSALSNIPVYSLADIFACIGAGKTAFLEEHFKGRAVILGTSLDVEDRILSSVRLLDKKMPDVSRCTPTPDVRHDPLYARATIPGVLMHASATRNLIEGDALIELSTLSQALAAVTVALAASFAALIFGPVASALIIAITGLVWVGAGVIAFDTGQLLPLFAPLLAGGLTLASMHGYRFAVADRMGRQIRRAFGHYLAPSIVDQLVAEDRMPEQGGEMRHMTVWISDLENYSTYSEILSPVDLVQLLNTVYTDISDTIEAHKGFVAQFVGDAVVGAFGAPLDDPAHPLNGVLAAMACAKAVDDLNNVVDLPDGLRLRIRIGVSTGPLVVGNIGSKKRLSYTLVGDDINLSSRLEGANKFYGTQILVNGETVAECGDAIVFREVDVIRVKGRDTPVTIFEPVGLRADIAPARLQELAAYGEALALYKKQEFDAAKTLFAATRASDPVSSIMFERCQALLEAPPGDDWDGVNTLTTK